MRWERKPETAVVQIDFLPAHYHEEYSRRRTRASRILFICIFAAVLPTASLYQYRLRLSVDRQLAEIDQQHSESQTDTQRLAGLNGKLAEQDALAQLAVFLKHPWPHTQILAAVIAPLPASMSLEEVVVHREAAPTSGPVAEPASGQETKPPAQPATEDLQALRSQAQGKLVVQLTGRTSDSRQLHSYLYSLGSHPLFTHAELNSIESEPQRDGHQALARFEARLYVRPSHGMPGSPPAGPPPPGNPETLHSENPS